MSAAGSVPPVPVTERSAADPAVPSADAPVSTPPVAAPAAPVSTRDPWSPPEPDKGPERRNPWHGWRWLSPGIGIKRWIVVGVCGALLVGLGLAMACAYQALDLSLTAIEKVRDVTHQLTDPVTLGIYVLAVGAVLLVIGVRGSIHAVQTAIATVTPEGSDFMEAALRRRRLETGYSLVTVGGGTGLSTMLRGLKEHTSNITAVVTMADDGGSSGQLRVHGLLPPGDLRNCMAALADSEAVMTDLVQYRFKGHGLDGHVLGNLLVAAMCEITDDFAGAVRNLSKVLAIRGKVLPSTLENVQLSAILMDGTEVVGQRHVNKASGIRQVFLEPVAPAAFPDVLEAIADADAILIGPGSLYTSIIPNLLIPEILQAVRRAEAPKIYICNVMTQPGETSGYKASDHVKALIQHVGHGVVTHVLLNNGKVSADTLTRYRQTGAEYVTPDLYEIEVMGLEVYQSNLIDTSNVVRHNPRRLADSLLKIIRQSCGGPGD